MSDTDQSRKLQETRVEWLVRRLLVGVLLLSWAGLLATSAAVADDAATQSGTRSGLRVIPEKVTLHGNFARAQLLVTNFASDQPATERSPDMTGAVGYRSMNPDVVTVTPRGQLLAIADGETQIEVSLGAATVSVPVSVSGVLAEPVVTFNSAVQPILSKAGCNMGACHATQHGQGGFKLSVFGSQPNEDREAIVRDRQQRRVSFLDPDASLLLRKPTLQIAHGGGRRLRTGDTDYQMLVEWIRAGAPAPDGAEPSVTGIVVTPAKRSAAAGETQQLRVVAEYSDGKSRDVTNWAKFQSMDEAILSVADDGLVKVLSKGQATILVRFEGHAVNATCAVPYANNVELAGWTNHNFVDELAATKFRELGIQPSGLCDDAAFVRRAFLDTIGGIPTVSETRAFLDDENPNKRTELIDRLLGLTGESAKDLYNDRYAAYWTLKWSDLIRNRSDKVGEQGMWALHNWIRESFRLNKPFDRFVTELVTAKGSIYSNGPANYFRINGNASDLTESTAQLFLGVRLQCAKCHHHPFEKYSREDYQAFSRFFARVGTKSSQEFGLFGRESVVVVKMNKTAPAKPLGGEPVDHPLDPRISLAEWLTSQENEFFAKSIANRYVSYLMGRGLVEPVDDMRNTNPASNGALLEALAAHFIESGYDLKQLIRAIMVSRLYQLESRPTEENNADNRFFSHYKVKRIAAEPLLDAIDQSTGVATKFKQLPAGTRAIELPDANYPNYFLKTFGKPKRASVCECERVPDENLAQALHSLNGGLLAKKIAGKTGRVAKLLEAKTPHEEVVAELYLASLCRMPTEPERAACRQFLEQSPSPKECYEDLLWALLNSKQFLFVR